MKIFFCETYDDGTVGGSHACMFNLIRHMDKQKTACTAGFVAENSYVKKYKDLGIPVAILPIRNPLKSGNAIARKAVNWYRLEYKAGRYLEDFFEREGFNLVVLNNSIYASQPFVDVCRKMRIPVVVYERGVGPFRQEDIKATAHIQASIPISETVRSVLLENHFRTKLIEMIYDGIDPDDFKTDKKPEQVKEELDIPADSAVIGMVGNIRPWKGQRYFIEGFIQLAKQRQQVVALVIGGWGNPEEEAYLLELKKMVREAGLDSKVRFLGQRSDVPDLMSCSDVFVHASIKPEPFGMVILEAMAARKPVVATDSGGPVEILNNGEFGILVPPRDGNAITAACLRYLDDDDFRERTIEEAYERVMRDFHISRTVRRTTEFFGRVLSKSESRVTGTRYSEAKTGESMQKEDPL